MQKNGKVMFDNKTESEAKRNSGISEEVLWILIITRKKSLSRETVSLMRLVYMTVKKCVIW